MLDPRPDGFSVTRPLEEGEGVALDFFFIMQGWATCGPESILVRPTGPPAEEENNMAEYHVKLC